MADNCCLKCIIISLNIIFGLIGVVFLGVGLFVKFGADDMLEKALNASLSSVQSLGGSLGVENYDGSSSFDLHQLVDLLNPVVTVFIVFGAFLLIMLILGCVGVCCTVKCALWLYAIIIIVILLAQLLLVVLFFTRALDGQVKGQMLDTIKTKYIASDSYDIYSVMWNVLHQKYQCCGVTDYKDYHGAEKWNRNRTVDVGGAPFPVYLQTPFSCCKPDASDYHCADAPTDLTNYMSTSCYEKIWASIDTIKLPTIGAIAVILVLQLLCAVAAIVIAKNMSKKVDYA